MTRSVLALAILVLSGCSSPDPDPTPSGSPAPVPAAPGPVVHGSQHDSAGIRIVLVPPRAAHPMTWELDSVPVADFGGLEADPDLELDASRGTRFAARLSNGTYAILDGTRVRIHAATGATIVMTGRRGGGPGEFQELASLCVTRGDTIVVNDPVNGRVTILDQSGRIVGGIPVGSVEVPWYGGCLNDGTFIETHRTPMMDDALGLLLVRRSVDGAQIDTLGRFWSSTPSLFLSIAASVTAVAHHIFYGDPRTGEIRVLDSNGVLERIIRFTDPPEMISRASQAAMQPRFFGKRTNAPESKRRMADQARQSAKPTKWPMFNRVAADQAGRIWVEEYRKSPTAPYLYTAINLDGDILGRLIVPAPTAIGDPLLIGFAEEGIVVLRQDDDGATHITIHRLMVASDNIPSVD